MVKKISGEYFLNRSEVIDYLLCAYNLKWCNTKWNSKFVEISFANNQDIRSRISVPAYKMCESKIVHLRKRQIDLEMLRIVNES